MTGRQGLDLGKGTKATNLLFNDWQAFEHLPNHLEFEALQFYDIWFEDHRNALKEVVDYKTQCVDLITALKGVAILATMLGMRMKQMMIMKNFLLLR